MTWRLVLEKEVRGDGVLDGFVWLLDWWRTLQFGRYRHFVTLLQCSTSQMKRAAVQLNRTFSFPDDVRKTTAIRWPRVRTCERRAAFSRVIVHAKPLLLARVRR